MATVDLSGSLFAARREAVLVTIDNFTGGMTCYEPGIGLPRGTMLVIISGIAPRCLALETLPLHCRATQSDVH